MAEQYKEVYRRFYAKLIKSLPMTDAHFRAALVSKQLLCGDLLDQVNAKGTNTEKSEHFLINTIDCSLNVGMTNPFVSLLQVMESFDSPVLQGLAKDINTDLPRKDTSTNLLPVSEPQTQFTPASVQPLNKGKTLKAVKHEHQKKIC